MSHARISWSGSVPVSDRHDDPYYSRDNGAAESSYVFIEGNHLRDRLRPGFHVAELGFGTGLNLLLALGAARAAGTLPLRYTGFEAYPMTASQMERALAAFPEVAADAPALVAAWAEGTRWITDDVEASVILGRAETSLASWDGHADAWFLDGFAPARNPDLWSPALMAMVARRTSPGGTFATYTAAGHVRRALADAGFRVERIAGFGRKRHMTRGVLG